MLNPVFNKKYKEFDMKFSQKNILKRFKNIMASTSILLLLIIISMSTLRSDVDIISGQCTLPAVSGVTIEILDGATRIDLFTTGSGGYYSRRMSNNWSPGTYNFYAYDANGSFSGTVTYVAGNDIVNYDFVLGVN